MSEYPTSPSIQHPVEISENWKTITSAFDSGKEQRRQKQIYAKYDVSLTYSMLSAADIAALWNFYNARRGAYESFYFYYQESCLWTGLFVGTGDATTQTFDLPGKSTTLVAIYINSVLQVSGYTVVTGGGTENSDRVTFTSAPALNDIITCDYTGFMRIKCRFAEDKLSKQVFVRMLSSTGIKLKGLAANA